MHKSLITGLSVILLTAPLAAQDADDPAPFTIADTRAGLAGQWQGKLEYRDYRADRWFGIPVMVDVELVDDGATVIRKARFDDGPATGMVYITTVSMLGADGKTEYVGSFRADRPAELDGFALRLGEAAEGGPFTAENWTLIAERDGEDDNRPARIRETTTRDGSRLVTLKEVDYRDDDQNIWLARNRTTLDRLDPVGIRIAGFECGDNCYLDYHPLAGPDDETRSALCSVDICRPWFEEQAMPPAFAGRSATITVGTGKQYDNEYNVMSDDFPAILSITVGPSE